MGVRRPNRHRIGRLRLVVIAHTGLSLELSGRRLNGKRYCSQPRERVGQRVAVRIRRRYRRANVLTCGRVLNNAAGGSRTRIRWLFGLIRDIDGYGHGIAGVERVRRPNRHRIRCLCFVVVGHAGLGLDLPGPRLDVERHRVGTFKRVGQRVAVWVHGRHRRADVLARRRVLGKAADGISVCEHWRGVVRLSASRRRPVARRLVVQRPHPHLIIVVRPELRDRGAGSGAIVLPGFPVADGALSVFHLIARERRSAVAVRRFPAHQQAGA